MRVLADRIPAFRTRGLAWLSALASILVSCASDPERPQNVQVPRPPAAVVSLATVVSEVTTSPAAIWAFGTGRLFRVDPQEGRTVATFSIPTWRRDVATISFGRRLAASDGSVWVLGTASAENPEYGASPVRAAVWHLDPGTNRITGPIRLEGLAPGSLAAAGGAAWLIDGRRLVRIDPGARAPALVVDLGENMSFASSAAGAESLWIAQKVVRRIALATGRVTAVIPIPIKYGTLDLAVHPDGIWLSGSGGMYGPLLLVRIDPATNAIVGAPLTLPSAAGPAQVVRLATDGSALWALSGHPHGQEAWLVRIDTVRNRVASVIDVGARTHAKSMQATGLAVAAGAVWVARGNVLEKLSPEANE